MLELPEDTSMIGTTLTHYAIDAKLGEGGMGTVYRARDTVLGRIVAIKVLSPDAEGDPEMASRILREAKATSRLNHPNIVTVHEFARAGDVDFIVMEYVDGQSLAGHIPPGGLPLDRVVDHASQIASGLAAAHEAGLVHRDVKPGNVMITRSGQVKVVDFGLARELPPAPDAETRAVSAEWMTRHGTLVGTVGYMAPEQMAGATADARSDVFALGALMFEMLTGERPFKGHTVWDTLQATLAGDAPDVGLRRPDTPPELARIVTRALARRPEDRYSSAAELADGLAALRTKDGADARPPRRRFALAAVTLVSLVAAGALGTVWWRESRLNWVRTTAIPEISKSASVADFDAAFRLARQALAIAPDEPQLRQLWRNVSEPGSFTSDPPGAEVEVQGYLTSREWIPLGTTPIARADVPDGLLRWRVTKPGYQTLEVSGPADEASDFHLTLADTAPAGMVFVASGPVDLDTGTTVLPDYWIDQHEVTNRQFKEFVDAGGYRTRDYWHEPFVKDGRTLDWDQAIAEFRDTTGRPGPSTWEVGGYPEGQDNFPVSGVSWYEAAAYAAYAGKQLPTVYHWYRASGAFSVFSDIITASNFSGQSTVQVGQYRGLGPYGTFDMAGNVKEWCWNSTNAGRRYVLGGSFRDASYQFRDQDAQSPFERASGFGFRTVTQSKPMTTALTDQIQSVQVDPDAITPVDDAVYRVFTRQFDYDETPLEATVETIEDTPLWRRERVSFTAAYGKERVPVYLFVPKSSAPPYQVVLFAPGSSASMASSSAEVQLQWADFWIRGGRVLAYPVYAGTYERRTAGTLGPNELRDLMVKRGKDLRRTIDYLQTRSDMDASRIAFYGMSLGAQMGPLFLTIEPRLRTGVLMSGGFETWQMPPEVDPVNYTPHVTVPVIMVNGREDFDLPYATAQVPMFNMLGTPAADKQHAVFEGGHIPSRQAEPIKVMLDWLDRYLGPVQNR